MTALRLGTRRSALAMAQSGRIALLVRERTGRAVELIGVATFGDRSTAPLDQIGGTGVFVSALRDAVLAGEVDFAVHSLKDLPTADPAGLTLVAVPEREDPRDVLHARDELTFDELPPRARVGTGSPRRAALLRGLRPDLEIVGIRGNVETRLAMVADGTVDAVVLAHAGLSRLGRADVITDVLDPAEVIPAPGQGALAVECRSDSAAVIDLLSPLDHLDTRSAVTAERAVLAGLQAGCSAPVGAHARFTDGAESDAQRQLVLHAAVVSVDGRTHISATATGSVEQAAEIGFDLSARLLDDGAGALVGPDRPAP